MPTATTRDKQLTKTINHKTGTTAVMIRREFNGPDGQWWPMEPIDASQDAAAINAFDASFTGSQQAQITQLTADIAAANAAKQQAESDKAAAIEQLQAANARIAELEAQLNPTQPTEVTPAQIRVWLVTHGVELAQVDAFIASIPDPVQREIARIKWEYGVAVIRTDPLVQQLGLALHMTAEQIDAAFAEASQLWSV